MATEKRSASNAFGSSQMVVKRQKSSDNLSSSTAVTVAGNSGNGALIQGSSSSSLSAPLLSLTGHTDSIHATRFSPTGQSLASASGDRKILLWHTYGSNENYGQLSGHKSAVLDLGWSRDGSTLFSASADKTIASWDLSTGLRIRRHEGHEEVVNAISLSRRGEALVVSGSDDGAIGLWDPRMKYAAAWIEGENEMPVTAVAIPEAGNEIFSGGVDEVIKVWDIRKKAVSYRMPGHADTVSSLEVSPDSQYLLSFGFDGVVKMWDIRPFAPVDRCVRSFDGASPGLDRNLARASWDAKGERVVAGSGDGSVVVWEARTGRLLAKLPGHKGGVNDVRFEPTGAPVLASASTDRTLLLGEIGR